MTDLSNDARNSPSERSSVTVTPAISESSDSDDEMPRPIRRPRQQRAVGVRGRGRGWGRGRGGRGVNNAQGERPAIVNGVGVGDIPLAAETVLVNGRNLNWDTYDGVDPYDSEWLPDFTGRQGVLVDTTDFDPLKYFQLFFPEEAFVLICNETNKYATQFFDNTADFPPSSRFHKWEETDIQEMKAYVALQICMGMCHKNDLEEYWSTFWLTSTPFGEVMSRNRYELLTSFLHFADNNEVRPNRQSPDYDLLWKIRPLMNICEPKYLAVYGPHRELSIDESIIKFKGRISFRQYLPAKPYKWGIKQFVICESKTGYALRFLTYIGKGSLPTLDGFSVTESICLYLLEGFENNGHIVYTDNYYTSPALYLELERRNIGATGTVKAGRKGMPRSLHPQQLALRKGDDPVFMRASNLVACAWQDTKRVSFLSTTETNNTIDKRVRQRGADGGHRIVEKPVLAEKYNQHMGGVDILDQKLGSYSYPHKSSKWYTTIFHRLREVALVNGYIVYCKDAGEDAVPPKVFREHVVSGLLEGYMKKASRRGRPSTDVPTRLTERHFAGKYEDPKYKPDCVVCSSRTKEGWKRKQTNYMCKQCNLPMCFIPCHEIYHTNKNFQQEAARVVYNL